MSVLLVNFNLQISSSSPTHLFSKYGTVLLRYKIMDFYIR